MRKFTNVVCRGNDVDAATRESGQRESNLGIYLERVWRWMQPMGDFFTPESRFWPGDKFRNEMTRRASAAKITPLGLGFEPIVGSPVPQIIRAARVTTDDRHSASLGPLPIFPLHRAPGVFRPHIVCFCRGVSGTEPNNQVGLLEANAVKGSASITRFGGGSWSDLMLSMVCQLITHAAVPLGF